MQTTTGFLDSMGCKGRCLSSPRW